MSEGSSKSSAVGNCVGAAFLIFFGGLWAFAGILSLGRNGSIIVSSSVTLLAVILILTLVVNIKRLSGLPEENFTDEMKRQSVKRRRLFALINAVQWTLIVAVVSVLMGTKQSQLIVPAISVIVGLHFFALLNLFKIKFDLLTGFAMILLPMIAVPLFSPLVSNAIISFGDALVLWIGAVNRIYKVHNVLLG
jgi:hypothetical protein